MKECNCSPTDLAPFGECICGSVNNTIKMNKTHGGKRKGAGRKPKEPTKTIRVPISLIDQIKELIKTHKP